MNNSSYEKCRKIHRAIIDEGGTLLHFGDKTVIICLEGFEIGVKHSDEERMSAAKLFWNFKASKKLKQSIVSNRSDWLAYCREQRVEKNFDGPLPPGIGSSGDQPPRVRHAKVTSH